jgi:hypothetical protein
MEAALAGTTMNPAYWGMLADASFYTGTQTDVRDGGNGGTFTPGQQKMPSQSGSGVGDFLLGFIPGYDLYQATQNSNAGVVDYAVGILGVAPGLGKGAGLGVKAVDAGVGAVKTAGQLGREGEAAVRSIYDLGKKQEFVIDGRTRIPDGTNLRAGTLSEVKNTQYQGFTQQLGVPEAMPWRPVFIRLIRSRPPMPPGKRDGFRDGLAVAIGNTTGPHNVEETLELLRDRSLGESRILMTSIFRKLKDPVVQQALLDLREREPELRIAISELPWVKKLDKRA